MADFTRLIGAFCLLLLMAVQAIGSPRQTTDTSSPSDVIVAEVMPGSAAEKAGLRAGDVLLSYAGRPLSSQFGFVAAVDNSPPASKVTVKARRGSQIMELTIPLEKTSPSEESEPNVFSAKIKITVRPVLSPEILSLYTAGLAKFEAKDWEAANAKWQTAFLAADTARDTRVSIWLCGCIITCYRAIAVSNNRFQKLEDLQERKVWIRNLTEAQTWIQHAWECVKDGEDKAARANILINLGGGNLNLGNIEAAFPWFGQAYSVAALDGNEVWAATARDWQGVIILGRHVPGSPNFRNDVSAIEKDLEQARRYCNEALEIRRRILPASLPLAESFHHMGWVALIQGELEPSAVQGILSEGQRYYAQALDLYQKIAPKSAELAGILSESAELAMVRGDALNAQRSDRAALALYQGADSLSQQMRGTIFHNLAVIFAMQGDLDGAKQYTQRSLDTYPKMAYGYQAQRFVCLTTLALISLVQKDHTSAKHYCEQALALRGVMNVVSQEEKATILNTLGLIATSDNQLPEAQQYYTEALKIWQVGPLGSVGLTTGLNGAGMATSLNGLGMVATSQGHLADAQAKFQQARVILRVAPTGVSQEATFAANLGRVYLRQHQPDKALPLLKEAFTVLETRRQHIPDLDSRALFMQLYANPFADLIQAYLTLHQPDKAFDTLERLHARAFADNLAEWRLQLDQHLPPTLKGRQQELDNARRISEKDLQRATIRKNADAQKTAQDAIAKCIAEQSQIKADIRQYYIRRIGHDIEYPQPIDLKAAQQCLPNGTLALAYSVDDDSACLFVLTNSSFRVCPLPLSRKLLTARVKQARDILTDIHSTPQTVESVLKALYRDLLKPAQAEITRAHTLLICPDSALNLLPFAALMPGNGRYLIQDKPLTMVASLTAYRSLRANKRPPMTSLLVLGDPVPDASTRTKQDTEIRPKTMGETWERLPETVNLAREIKAQYAPHSMTLLQEQATVANFLARCGQASIVHLGCHGVADNQNPFGSWLALTPASKDDNGRLAAWQILHLRLKAKLVVLWGCETGLGQENRYEGILGLPRAFQTAGAENVLMTLWEVHPKETSQILRDFYLVCKANRKAKTLAMALREAQIKAINSKTASAPYFWAAFVLNGVGE